MRYLLAVAVLILAFAGCSPGGDSLEQIDDVYDGYTGGEQ